MTLPAQDAQKSVRIRSREVQWNEKVNSQDIISIDEYGQQISHISSLSNSDYLYKVQEQVYSSVEEYKVLKMNNYQW